MTFSDFQAAVADGDVQTARFLLGDGVIEGELSDGTPYRVAYVEGTEETLTQSLEEQGVEPSPTVSVSPIRASRFRPTRRRARRWSASCSS